jgi:hypothetical protein
LFEFIATASTNEISLTEVKNDKSIISTTFQTNKENSQTTYNSLKSGKAVLRDIHSHPASGPPSKGDLEYKKAIKQTALYYNLPIPNFLIFKVDNKKYEKY